MATELVLTYMSGPHDGETVRMAALGDPPECTFGRSEACSIQIQNDPDISRSHARLYWNNGKWWLQDLGSLNGTYLGEFLRSSKVSSPLLVMPGQIFRMGAARFRFDEANSHEGRRQAEAAEINNLAT
jgi:pSer/pThr/pTyr-binding forkhead associated (FHA) protein